ncbi:hypothetical protein M9Y10_009686 [Tritrichomonas musculus]|uniref:Lipid-binding serum glycoprotein C-terminal domain-containing protein n=1 Tax=Tritrichomonas musculus TaxID=1915356 RepID=A0ABR2IP81_9EUKA
MNGLNLLLGISSLLFNGSYNDICDFDCWLRNLVIHVPTISSSVPLIQSNISVDNMVIRDMSISKIYTSFYPHEDKIEDGLKIDLNITASLTSDLLLSGFFNIGGDISVTASSIYLSFAFKFIKDPINNLITNVSFYNDDSCSVKIGDLKLDMNFDSKIAQSVFDILHSFIIREIKSLAPNLICNSVKPLIKEKGSQLFQFVGDIIRPYLNGSHPIDIPINPDIMADLRKSQLIDLIRFVLTNLTNQDGPINLNNLVNRFSDGTGIFTYHDIANLFGLSPTLAFNIPISSSDLNANITLGIEDFVLSDLNTWSDFIIFEPISEYVLDSRTLLNKFGFNVTFTINVSAKGEVQSLDLTERAFLHAYVENSSLDFMLQYATIQGTGQNYTSAQCTDVNCILKLASEEGTGVKMLQLNTSIGEFDLEDAEGTHEEYVQEFINTIIKFFIYNYRNQIPVFFNGFINEYGIYYMNNMINTTLRTTDCQPLQDPPYQPINILVSWISLGMLLFSIIAVLFLYYLIKWQKINHRKQRENQPITTLSLSTSSSGEKAQFEEVIYESKWLTFWREDNDASLFMHPKVPLWVRLLMPVLIMSNISLFLSANASYGGSVFIKILLGGDKYIEMPSMFNFGLINSIRDMWKAGTYVLSLIVLCMSCIWPYSKLILMFIVWFIPATILHRVHRERILRLLDELGKWSLLDSYFMIMMVVSFHFILTFPIVNQDAIVDPNIVYVWVLPCYGFIGLIGGTIYSLALSHIICYLDRHVNKPENQKEVDEQKSKKKVCVFTRQNISTKIILIIFLLCQLIVFCIGISCNSFSFEFVGLTGWALDILKIPNKSHYTVIQLAYKFPTGCEFPNSASVRFIQVIYWITAIIVPMLHILGLAATLLFPMNLKQLDFMYNAIEILYAWSCLDVFVVSLIVTMFQITRFTNWMVGDRCDFIDEILKLFFNHEKYIEGHYKCFEVLTVFEKGTFLLVSAAVINTIAHVWINILTRRVLKNDEEIESYVPIADRPENLLESNEYTNVNNNLNE